MLPALDRTTHQDWASRCAGCWETPPTLSPKGESGEQEGGRKGSREEGALPKQRLGGWTVTTHAGETGRGKGGKIMEGDGSWGEKRCKGGEEADPAWPARLSHLPTPVLCPELSRPVSSDIF